MLQARIAPSHAFILLGMLVALISAAFRIQEVNATVRYAREQFGNDRFVESNLKNNYTGYESLRIRVDRAFILSEKDTAKLATNPLLLGYLDNDTRYVVVIISTEDGEPVSPQEAAPYLYLQSGVRYWQSNPLVLDAASELLSPLLGEYDGRFYQIFAISPHGISMPIETLLASDFSLVTSTWPKRVSVSLDSLPTLSIEEEAI